MATPSLRLSPAQMRAFEAIKNARGREHVVVLRSRDGAGCTTVARALADEFQAAWLDARDFLGAMKGAHPGRIEEEWCDTILAALRERRALVVDDFDLGAFMNGGCRSYPRSEYLEVGLASIGQEAKRLGAWLLFVGTGHSSVLRREVVYGIPKYTALDQEHLFREIVGPEPTQALDFEKIFRFAPTLTARQIARVARFIARDGLTTEALIEHLRTENLVTNVDLGQVEAVDLRDLQGVDDVLEKLESNIILPLENDELAKRFQLTPRRGALLYGPPGTGKTTVGRALAHRLKSKFFLIDGTFISGTSDFYRLVMRVFEQAKRNAPAIVFIDDSDVIFESGEETGFYRYLLTILDGLESEEAGRLTVMLTAMDLAHLPPALIRSGRIELWLEMKLPDSTARRRVLEQRFERSVPERFSADWEPLIEATDGFTGAELRRLVEDGKNLWAHAIAKGNVAEPNAYFLRAASEIAHNKRTLHEAGERAATRGHGHRRGRPDMPFEVLRMIMNRESG